MMKEDYSTIRVRFQDGVCFIQIYRPDDRNTINYCLINEISDVLDLCDNEIKIVVLEGLPDVFCLGADFNNINKTTNGENTVMDPSPLYDLWLKLATGPYVSVAHIEGKVNAGGVGFVAACDIVICGEDVVFSLSELLFGLMPACVLPFLIRRIGCTRSNYMTLMTTPVSALQAHQWGLVDIVGENSRSLLRMHLLRLNRSDKTGVLRYKKYMNDLDDFLFGAKEIAIKANMEVFSDLNNKQKIEKFILTGKFPWEQD